MKDPDFELGVEPRLFDLSSTLGHNDWSLSDTAALEAQHLLAAAQLQLNLLNAETPSGLVESTETKRAALETQTQLYRTAIASHRKLPNEILAEIFFVSFYRITVPSADLNSEPPWTLFRVCKRWRQIALTMPKLWTCICLYYKNKGDDDQRWIRMSKVALVRSEERAVSLKIIGGRSRGYTKGFHQLTPLTQAFREIVIPIAHRLRKFHICATNRELNEIFVVPSPRWDMLQKLVIDCSGKNSTPEGVIKPFENAPRLRTLKFSIKIFSPSAYHLPWAHITKLDMPYSKMHPSAALDILKQCNSIEICSLSFSDNMYDSSHRHIRFTDIPQGTPSPIILPALKTLDVDIYKCSSFTSFLKPLVLPQLTAITVDGETVMVPHPWKPEYIPVLASYERLKSCSVNISVPSIDIDDLLKRITPLLTILSLPRGILSTTTLRSLASGELLPNLKRLCCKITDETIGAYLDVIEHRETSTHVSAIKAEFYWIHSEADFRQEGREYAMRFKALEESGRLRCHFHA